MFQALSDEVKRVFDCAVTGWEVAWVLAGFHTLAVMCKWNVEAQWDMFLHRLADRILKETFVLELPTDLDGFIELVIQVGAHLQQCDQ